MLYEARTFYSECPIRVEYVSDNTCTSQCVLDITETVSDFKNQKVCELEPYPLLKSHTNCMSGMYSLSKGQKKHVLSNRFVHCLKRFF